MEAKRCFEEIQSVDLQTSALEDSGPHCKEFEGHFSTMQRQNETEQRLLMCVEPFTFQLQLSHDNVSIVAQTQPKLFQG